MRSTFAGLDIARKALLAHSRALDVTGHNIANQATPGYSRQRAHLTATKPYTVPAMHTASLAGQVGTGVQVSTIYRLRDGYIDYQWRSQNQHLGKALAENQTLDRIEGIFSDLLAGGLRAAMAEFFNAWQDLSRDGSNSTVRAIVQQRGVALSDMFRHISSQMQDVVDDVDHGIALTVIDLNSLFDRIGSLNVQIQANELGGWNANDLRDQRDLLIDELSGIVDLQVSEHNGQLSVIVGGVTAVRHESVTHVRLSPNAGEDGAKQIHWVTPTGEEGIVMEVSGGRVAGLQASRSKTLDYMARLDALAAELAQAVNEQHRQGFTLVGDGAGGYLAGGDFFVGLPSTPDKITARDMFLHSDLLDPDLGQDRIAAGTVDADGLMAAGDGSNALALGQLRNALLFRADPADPNSGTATLEQYYEGIIGTLGVDAQHVLQVLENQTLLVNQLDMRRSSISGVSLDEEITNLIQHQHAYNATARYVNVLDEVLDTLINRMGLR